MYNELTSRLHSFGELLSMSIKLYTTNFLQLALIPGLIILPVFAIQTYLSMQQVLEIFSSTSDASRIFSATSFNGSFAISMVFALVSVLVEIGLIRATYLYLKGEPVQLSDVAMFSVKKWPAVLVTGIVVGFCLGALTILLIVPAVIFGVYWLFTFQATVLEDKVASDAMSLSKNIVENRWLKTFGYIIVVLVVIGVVAALMGALVSVFQPGLASNPALFSATARGTTSFVRAYAAVADSYRANFAQIYLVQLLSGFFGLVVGHLWMVFTTVWFVNWNKFRVQKAQTVVEATK